MASDTQKLDAPKRGQRITADDNKKMIALVKRLIVGGKGILVRKAGDQVVIESRAMGGGTAAVSESWAPYERASEEALIATTTTDNGDPLPYSALAVITNGDLSGSWWGRNPNNTGWRCLTVWREP